MDTLQTLSTVSNAVTDQPVTIEVNIDPQSRLQAFLLKIKWIERFFPAKKILTILPIRMGSLIKISKLVLTISEEDLKSITQEKKKLQSISDSHHLITKYGETLVQITALAIHNKKSEPPKKLVDLIRDQFAPKALFEILMMVLRMMDTQNFTLSIISIRGLNLLEMNPQTQGSSIAPGTSSEE